jgi:hypothetical protein
MIRYPVNITSKDRLQSQGFTAAETPVVIAATIVAGASQQSAQGTAKQVSPLAHPSPKGQPTFVLHPCIASK